jgi:hypothetical protein
VVQPFIFNFLFLRCDSISVVQSVAQIHCVLPILIYVY